MDSLAFHPGCYTCNNCGTSLAGASVYVVDNEVYCKEHSMVPVPSPNKLKGGTTMDRLAAQLGTADAPGADTPELDERGLRVVK